MTGAFVFGIAVYTTVTIPSLRTIVDPVVGIDTRDDQIEAVRVLSAGNTILVVLLGGLLLPRRVARLRGGLRRAAAERVEGRDEAALLAELAAATSVGEELRLLRAVRLVAIVWLLRRL